jgi:hypothetical protein
MCAVPSRAEQRNVRSVLTRTLVGGLAMGVTAALAVHAPAMAGPEPGRPPIQPSAPAPPTDPSRLANPAAVLPADWQRTGDRIVTTVGDRDGLHVLVAEESTGYHWRIVATLAEPGADTDQWIGQACLTGSGARAVVVYAPRQFTNHGAAMEAGAFVAIVDTAAAAVRKLPQRVSLAYFNPGCGSGEEVALTSVTERTTVDLVDTRDGAVTRRFSTSGQLTSAVPYNGKIAGSIGARLVSVDPGGTVTTLASNRGAPFRIHPDGAGGLAYQVPAGKQIEIHRWAAGRGELLGAGAPGTLQVASSAGRVFVVGRDRGMVRLPERWTRVDAPTDTDVSSTGALAVTRTAVTGDGKLAVDATVTGNQNRVGFIVRPSAAASARGGVPSPALKAGSPAKTGPSTVSFDPDRACAVPRNDPAIQTLQPTAAQVEWAADRAVLNRLMITRPVNWAGSGMPVSWQPQTLFPRHALNGGDHVPVQVLLGVLAQESNTMQASPHAVDGVTGNFNQGGFYGDWLTWDDVDCGYGVGQVTTGMSVAEGHTVYTDNQQKAIATDYASNIAASLNALIDKWNQLKSLNITANDGSPDYIENWYLAAWAYNTGLQPSPQNPDTAGNWGLGWLNNPANPIYPYDRQRFDGQDDYDTKHPNLWPYQEKVIGWAFRPVARFDYSANSWSPAFAPAIWSDAPKLPEYGTFCVPAANHCEPGTAHDVNGNLGAGRCLLMDLHCWWHQPNTTWVTCAVPDGQTTPCGREVSPFETTAGEPPNGNVYPPDCTAPASAIVVDEVTNASAVPCAKNHWTSQGSFALSFPANPPPGCTANCITYPGKIDFHQLSTGFGGHLWFAHTASQVSVTGTWKPPASRVGWTRIKVHIPQSGATTKQADYVVNLGNGQTRHRVVNQAWWKNTWVDLGAFNLSAGASVSLSNASANVAPGRVDEGDIAFDALAFIPSSQPVASYVALGDSYSSGEANIPFDSDSDQNGSDECHRSQSQAYPSRLHLPGQSSTIAALAANNQANFHMLACSGAESIDMSQAAVEPGNTDNTDWRVVNDYHFGEVNQIDEAGWLDPETTLVTLSIGGNDVGFTDVFTACWLRTACLAPDFYVTRHFGDWDPKVERVDPQPLTSYEPYLIGKLRAHLAALYRQVHVKAPNARVVVVGYPKTFTVRPGEGCQGVISDVQQWINQMQQLLIGVINGAVSDAKATYPSMNVGFVDVTNGFLNHGVCEYTTEEWINGLDLLNMASSFHPNSNGQAAFGAIVNAAL